VTKTEIARIRAAYNLTPTQFAQVLAVSRPTIYAWESGRTMPGPHERMILWRLAQATHDDASFTKTFSAIKQVLQYQQAAPDPAASPWQESPSTAGSTFGEKAVMFGLGVLFGALFAGAGDPPPKSKSRKRGAKGRGRRK